MMVLECTFEVCTYATRDIEVAQATALFTVHGCSLAPGACQQAKSVILSRPKLSEEITRKDWEYFNTRWEAYKTALRIADQDDISLLPEFCEDNLRNVLHRFHSNTAKATKNHSLAAIETLAVKAENDKGSSLSRHLKQLNKPMTLLGDNDQDMTLEHTIKSIGAKQADERSQATLQNQSATMLFSSKQRDKDQHLVKSETAGKRSVVTDGIHRAGTRSTKPEINLVQSVTKGTFVKGCMFKPKKTGENTTTDDD